MLFNSMEFAIYLPIVFILYWFVTKRNLKLQNSFLVLASYVFYGWWDCRFLSLIIFSSCIDYFVGLRLSNTENQKKRKLLLWTSICVNLGLLGFFKYFNFFTESFAEAFTMFGKPMEANRLNIILPVGISFYTFQTLSYTIDIYKRKLEPTKDIICFFAFVSFFPQLVAGPIERATNLLPQFYKKRIFNYDKAVSGVHLILWGLFKKVVIADNCAFIVNQIFSDYSVLSGSTLLLGAVLFAFQIYGDFSGYSDMAIGTAKLFGINLQLNFALPYFSRDIAEFWRRWHISLTTWFRDYLYIPLGGSYVSINKQIRNVFVIFIASGLWHGANWTFVIWGILNALLFLPLIITKNNRTNLDIVSKDKKLPSIAEVFQMTLTFLLTTFCWIFFRSESVSFAFDYIGTIFSKSLFVMPYAFGIGRERIFLTLFFIFVMLLTEWLNKDTKSTISLTKKICWNHWAFMLILAILVFLFGEKQQEFIYFQF